MQQTPITFLPSSLTVTKFLRSQLNGAIKMAISHTKPLTLTPNSLKPSILPSKGCPFITMKPQSISASSAAAAGAGVGVEGAKRRLPVLLLDVMGTIVRDPFYEDIPAFFGMSLKELIECKHPTAWVEFEKGLIDEVELAKKFFKDGRQFDLEGLKLCMKNGYFYIDGVEGLLKSLKQSNYEMHAFTNYPIWYQLIEDKLKLSAYLSWTFCSCLSGKRKPDPDFYVEVLHHLEVEPTSCIFVDDRLENVEAARNAGIAGIHFTNAESLRENLCQLGVDSSTFNVSNGDKLIPQAQ